uniref:Major histocompatibility complex, class II, DP beta 1 n=1 Tax=Suricata suricatta TaxID=37032 RepID=A0A673U377_SURSU
QMLSQPAAAPKLYLYQRRSTCYESNGTHRFLEQYIYNRELYVQFDSNSAAGVFVAVSELGLLTAKNWNIQKEFLALRRSAVDTVCKHNFELDEGFTLQRRVQPHVTVSPSKKGHLRHHNLLVCHVSDFYPGHIQVRWFLNGQEETAGILSTNPIHNGDWTFQILVMLEMTPQQGDVYTCQVEHPSLDGPVTVEWKAQSDSARSKMLAGVGGFVLGLMAIGVSFILRFRSQRGKKLLESGCYCLSTISLSYSLVMKNKTTQEKRPLKSDSVKAKTACREEDG